MNQGTATVAILAGAFVGGGVFLLVGFFMGVDMIPKRSGSSRALRDSLKGFSGRLVAGLAVGLALLILTRWVVMAAAGGVLVIVWPMLFGGAKEEKHSSAKVEALATWAESLRDTIAGAVGLEQAIPATVHASAPVIREDLALLADRMRVRVPLSTALRQFADSLGDPTADLIVSALIMNARLRGPGLRQLLGALADTARSELDMRQRVSASRAGTRRSARRLLDRHHVGPGGLQPQLRGSLLQCAGPAGAGCRGRPLRDGHALDAAPGRRAPAPTLPDRHRAGRG